MITHMKETAQENIDFEQLLAPENAMEKRLLQHPEFNQGLNWGIPRYGHPEGKVGLHIREVLDNIDRLTISDQDRENLRLIAYIHDTFKFEENKTPRENRTRHHGVIARQFLQEIAPSHLVLDIVEFHDEAFFGANGLRVRRVLWPSFLFRNRHETCVARGAVRLSLWICDQF